MYVHFLGQGYKVVLNLSAVCAQPIAVIMDNWCFAHLCYTIFTSMISDDLLQLTPTQYLLTLITQVAWKMCHLPHLYVRQMLAKNYTRNSNIFQMFY